MFKNFRSYFQLWRKSKNFKYDLDALLSQADHKAPLIDRINWLADVMQWVRYRSNYVDYDEIEHVKRPAARIKFLLFILERNVAWKIESAKVLRSLIRDISAVDLYTESGLPDEFGFWSELVQRIYNKIIPTKPPTEGMSSLLSELFPTEEDQKWLAELSPEIIDGVIQWIQFEMEPQENFHNITKDLEASLLILTSQVRSIGLSPAIRRRLPKTELSELPYFTLTRNLNDIIKLIKDNNIQALREYINDYKNVIEDCLDTFDAVYRHLDQHGVSLKVVYLLESAQSKLKRIDDLLSILALEKPNPELIIYFLSQLIEENQEKRCIFALIGQNTHLISKKIVDRSAETGEGYIARNKKDYNMMFKKACGGGAYVSFTVVVKYLLSLLRLPDFIAGFLHSVNYSFSFLAIQFSGYTLATKQPAMTGPALASKVEKVEKGESPKALIDEVVKLFRTQLIGAVGNVLMVIPCVFLYNFAFFYLTSRHMAFNESNALYLLNTTNLLGPTIIFAIFTGVLLWLSSVCAGYADNWFHLNRIKDVIIQNRRLKFVFGKERVFSMANFWESKISSIAGNVSLAFLLGLTPELMKFLGLFLDVRHVTLSAGTIAMGAFYFGLNVFTMLEFWLSALGVIVVGFLNIGVSFGLAFFVALKSRNIKPKKRRRILVYLRNRLWTEPLSFVYPTEKEETIESQ